MPHRLFRSTAANQAENIKAVKPPIRAHAPGQHDRRAAERHTELDKIAGYPIPGDTRQFALHMEKFFCQEIRHPITSYRPGGRRDKRPIYGLANSLLSLRNIGSVIGLQATAGQSKMANVDILQQWIAPVPTYSAPA